MSSDTKYELLTGLPEANVEGSPPAYYHASVPVSLTAITPPSPLPALNADGNMVLVLRPAPNLILGIVFFVLGWLFSLPLWIMLDDESGSSEDDDSLMVVGVVLPVVFWLLSLIVLLTGKTKALSVSPSEQTISVEEYHLLRCNRKSTVSHTFRFSDVRACVLTVDNGPCHSRLNGARNAQPHVGREPAGYISLLDASGEYHNVFGGYGGMRYVRTYAALCQYLRSLGALPANACRGRESAAPPAVLCDNCAGPLQCAGQDTRYVRLTIADIC